MHCLYIYKLHQNQGLILLNPVSRYYFKMSTVWSTTLTYWIGQRHALNLFQKVECIFFLQLLRNKILWNKKKINEVEHRVLQQLVSKFSRVSHCGLVTKIPGRSHAWARKKTINMQPLFVPDCAQRRATTSY